MTQSYEVTLLSILLLVSSCFTIDTNLEILPFYNQGMNSSFHAGKKIISEITRASVTYGPSNDLLNVTVFYFSLKTEFFPSFSLNGSRHIARPTTFTLASKSAIGQNQYTAHICLQSRKIYGACLLSFVVNVSNTIIQAQFLINLLPPYHRFIENERPSFIYVYPSQNIMTIYLKIITYIPMSIPWEHITIFKRIILKRNPSLSFIHMPLAFITQSPLKVTPLMLWSHNQTIFRFNIEGQLIIQSTSVSLDI